MSKNLLTRTLSEPLNGATAATIDINVGDGNLIVDQAAGEQIMISGTLQYLEKQDPPTCSMTAASGQASLALKAGGKGQPWLKLPWATCNGATEWRIQLNPSIPLDINAYTAGGNVRLDLSGLRITRLVTGTGGGNIDLSLPDSVASQAGQNGMTVTAKTGAGNLTVSVPAGIAARIQATSGLGKVILDPRFTQVNKTTYQTPDYDRAIDKVEMTLSSGAGNVVVKERAAQTVMVAA